MPGNDSSLQVVLKVASRCNLDCKYCYVFKKGDDSWRERPLFMPEDVFDAMLERTRRHCLASAQPSVTFIFHGGEPTLVGPDRFELWCRKLRATLEGITRVRLVLQTNGTLLDAKWAFVIRHERVDVAVSLDGPKHLNDESRVDHQGRSSYAAVIRGIDYLRAAGIPLQILSVIQFGADSRRIHRHFVQLGARTINYLFPDYTHDTIQEVRLRYGPTPCADFLLPVFDEWWSNDTMSVRVLPFWNIARLILGGDSEIDLFGNRPFHFLFVEADGTLEGLDVLKICRPGITRTELNVLHNDLRDVADVSLLHRNSIFTGVPLPEGCRGCPEETTCAGGYLPHRFSSARGFDNPTVWCADVLKLFAHVRERLGVAADETLLRRQVLQEMALEACSTC